MGARCPSGYSMQSGEGGLKCKCNADGKTYSLFDKNLQNTKQCSSYKLLAQINDGGSYHQVCVGEADGVIRASVPPCAADERAVTADLSGLAVLAA